MNIPTKLMACGTAAFFALAAGVHAQTASSTASQPAGATANSTTTTSALSSTAQDPAKKDASATQSAASSSSMSQPSASSTSTTQPFASTGTQPSTSSSGSTATDTHAGSFSGSASGSAAGSVSASGSLDTSRSGFTQTAPSSTTTTTTSGNTANAQNSAAATTGTQSNAFTGTAASGQSQSNANSSFQTNASTQNQVATTTSTVSDAQVTTFVQELDAQGPAVVQRASTVVGDLACSQDTIQNLVDALHSGKSVTITSDVNGQKKSATFNASGAHMGYGEAYIALALAAQELRNAGITSCATPEQWQAVLLGGPITTSVATSTTASGGATQFPGIVTLHTQGQGWGQIAQTTNVQLGQVINTSASSSLAPTGFSSDEMKEGRMKADDDKDHGKHKGEKKHWWSRGDKDDDKKDDKKADRNPNAATPSPKSDK